MKTFAIAAAAAAALLPAGAGAQTVLVGGQSNLYSPTGGGIAPPSIAVAGGQQFTFLATGSVTYNGGTFNNPDGYGSASPLNVNGANGLSGISVFQAGGLLGVFVGGTPGSPVPASLSYANAAAIGFGLAAPLLNQVFFIGDGLTGNGTGAYQLFTAPTGATSLLLGFADAPGYNGDPGAYGDNGGAFAVSYTLVGQVAGVPEPESWAMMIGGFGLAGAAMRRRRVRAAFA